jgi:hypothetical protein
MARKKAKATRKPRAKKSTRRQTTREPSPRAKARSKTVQSRSKSAKPRRKPAKARPEAARRRRDDLLGPPPREATVLRGDRDRQATERLAEHHSTSPKLTGGDVDADWERAASVGEEAVGGTVATPDKSVVDDLGAALGVPRAPDEPLRTSQEILAARDLRRQHQED